MSSETFMTNRCPLSVIMTGIFVTSNGRGWLTYLTHAAKSVESRSNIIATSLYSHRTVLRDHKFPLRVCCNKQFADDGGSPRYEPWVRVPLNTRTYALVFLCCVVLCRYIPCDGLIPHRRRLTKCLNSLRKLSFLWRQKSFKKCGATERINT
jgi:hypothetical protein